MHGNAPYGSRWCALVAHGRAEAMESTELRQDGLRQEGVLHSPNACLYLAMLHDRLQNRVRLTLAGQACVAEFGPGCCRLSAAAARLIVECEAKDAAGLAWVRRCVEAHLECCACGGEAWFCWSPPLAIVDPAGLILFQTDIEDAPMEGRPWRH